MRDLATGLRYLMMKPGNCGTFTVKKNGIKAHLEELLDKLKAAGIEVKHVRCNNAGEHILDQQNMCDGQYNIRMEYTTPPHTPQHDGVVCLPGS